MLSKGSKLCFGVREYTVLDLLGKGANTTAYLAECRQDGLISKCILKEYCGNSSEGVERFIASGKMQNEIRQLSSLENQTPPISHIFEANGTAYIDVVCFGGTTLDRLDLALPQYIAVCLTAARTVGYYHQAGCLCLDLKPDNIFVMQNSPEDTVTQLVEFIDFDSVRRLSELDGNTPLAYTADWCAPEQRSAFHTGKLTAAADIYALGELVFFFLFRRHSTDREHRGFSKYPFDECRKEYRRYTDRPDISALFTRLFRGTLRSSALNRFESVAEIVSLLERLVFELEKRDYIIPRLPAVPPFFTGREKELDNIAGSLKTERVLFITGIGGIGKSTLIKGFIRERKTDYDDIIYLEFDGDILRTFCDDMQLQISTVSRSDSESNEEYFTRKLTHLRRICVEKRVLFVLDNFSGRITKDLSRILDCGYDTVIVTRNRPPTNSFAVQEIGAIADHALMKLISLNLGRPLTKDERTAFGEIIELVQGHTLVLELIARQIASGRLGIQAALGLIRQHGFSRFSAEKIGNYKDGEEVYDTLSAIVTALFDAGGMSDTERLALKTLSLLEVRGLEAELVGKLLKLDAATVQNLGQQGWLVDGERIRVHPVIAETARSWEWAQPDPVSVMEQHKKAADIFAGTANTEQLHLIVREAKRYVREHQQPLAAAMYHDLRGTYYDTALDGAYAAYTDSEKELLGKLTDAMRKAIACVERSDDERRERYLAGYYLSLAGVLIRSSPEGHREAAALLRKARAVIPKDDCEDLCYYYMAAAWYHTLAKPDADKVRSCTERAERLAGKAFATDLERIDIIYIPTANCLYYLCDYEAAADKLEDAIRLCKAHADMLPYIDKRAELLRCQLDIFDELGDADRCRKLISEIDGINEKYREQGVFREVSPELREKYS